MRFIYGLIILLLIPYVVFGSMPPVDGYIYDPVNEEPWHYAEVTIIEDSLPEGVGVKDLRNLYGYKVPYHVIENRTNIPLYIEAPKSWKEGLLGNEPYLAKEGNSDGLPVGYYPKKKYVNGEDYSWAQYTGEPYKWHIQSPGPEIEWFGEENGVYNQIVKKGPGRPKDYVVPEPHTFSVPALYDGKEISIEALVTYKLNTAYSRNLLFYRLSPLPEILVVIVILLVILSLIYLRRNLKLKKAVHLLAFTLFMILSGLSADVYQNRIEGDGLVFGFPFPIFVPGPIGGTTISVIGLILNLIIYFIVSKVVIYLLHKRISIDVLTRKTSRIVLLISFALLSASLFYASYSVLGT